MQCVQSQDDWMIVERFWFINWLTWRPVYAETDIVINK
jgi:hypothetical protein